MRSQAQGEFDDDAISVDAAKMYSTAAFPAGVFASYHAHPYYPDFKSPSAQMPEGQATDGFRFVVQSYDPRAPRDGRDLLPRGAGGGFALPPSWTWPGWDEPQWHAERKPLFEAMRGAFASIPEGGERTTRPRRESRRVRRAW